MLDYRYEQHEYYKWIEHVAAYAKVCYGAEVDMRAEDDAFIYEVRGKKIQVRGETPPRDKLYILLHELGHLVRLIENASDNTYFMDRAGAKNEREKVMTLMEEVLAWHKADEIATKLEIPIEKRAWQRLVSRTVNKYVGWACDTEA